MSLQKIASSGFAGLTTAAECDAALAQLVPAIRAEKPQGITEALQVIGMLSELSITKNNTRKEEISAMAVGMKLRIEQRKAAL